MKSAMNPILLGVALFCGAMFALPQPEPTQAEAEAKAKPTEACQCTDCTCDPCECVAPEPEPVPVAVEEKPLPAPTLDRWEHIPAAVEDDMPLRYVPHSTQQWRLPDGRIVTGPAEHSPDYAAWYRETVLPLTRARKSGYTMVCTPAGCRIVPVGEASAGGQGLPARRGLLGRRRGG